MSRYKLTIEYDGGPFVGWQRQANGLSVQEALETAVARFSGEHVIAGWPSWLTPAAGEIGDGTKIGVSANKAGLTIDGKSFEIDDDTLGGEPPASRAVH